MYIEGNDSIGGPFGTMPQEPWLPRKDAKLSCGELGTHAIYKITRPWENFNNQGMKMILLLDEQWLIANNFANSNVNNKK